MPARDARGRAQVPKRRKATPPKTRLKATPNAIRGSKESRDKGITPPGPRPIRESERKRHAAQRQRSTHRITRAGGVDRHRKPTGAPRTMALPPAVARGNPAAVNQYLRDVRRAQLFSRAQRQSERIRKRQGLGYHGQERASGRAEPGGLTGGLFTAATKPVLTLRPFRGTVGEAGGGGRYKASALDIATAVPGLGLAGRGIARGVGALSRASARRAAVRKELALARTHPAAGSVSATGRMGDNVVLASKGTRRPQGGKLGALGRRKERVGKSTSKDPRGPTHAAPDIVSGINDLFKYGRVPYEKYRIREMAKRMGKFSARHPIRAGARTAGLGYSAAAVGTLPVAASDNTGSLPEWLRLATVPVELVKAAADDPGAFASATGMSAKSMLAGIPVGVAYAVQPAHWDNVVEMMKEDLSHRYGPLVAGDSEKFRKIAQENGLTPYFLDALAAGGGGSQVVGRLGNAGVLGRGFQNWMTRARPELRITPGGHAHRQRRSTGVAGRGGQHFLDWARKNRQANRSRKFLPDHVIGEGEVVPLTRRGANTALRKHEVQRKARGLIGGRRLKNQVAKVLAKVPKVTGHIPRNLRQQAFKEVYIHGSASGEVFARDAATRARMIEGERGRLGYVPPAKPDEVPRLKQLSQHPEYYTPEMRAVADEVRNVVAAIGDLDPALFPEQMLERAYAPLAQLLGPELLPPSAGGTGPATPGPRGPGGGDSGGGGLSPDDPDLPAGGLSIEEIRGGIRDFDARQGRPATTPEEAFPGLIRTADAERGDTAASNAYGALGRESGGTRRRLTREELTGGVDEHGRPIEPRIRDNGSSRESMEGLAARGAAEGGSVAPGQPGHTARGDAINELRAAGVPEDEIADMMDEWEQTLRDINEEFDGGEIDGGDIAELERDFDELFGNTADEIAGLPEVDFTTPIPRDEIPGMAQPHPRNMVDSDLDEYIRQVREDLAEMEIMSEENLADHGIIPDDIHDLNQRLDEAEAEQARRQGVFERDVEHDINELPGPPLPETPGNPDLPPVKRAREQELLDEYTRLGDEVRELSPFSQESQDKWARIEEIESEMDAIREGEIGDPRWGFGDRANPDRHAPGQFSPEQVAPITERGARAEQVFGDEHLDETDWLDDENFLTKEGLDELGFRGETPPPELVNWPEALKDWSGGRGSGTVALRRLFEEANADMDRVHSALLQSASKRTQDALERDKVPDPVTLYRHESEHPEEIVSERSAVSLTDRRKHANDHARSVNEEPNVKSHKVPRGNIMIYSEAFPEIFHRGGARVGEREFIVAAQRLEKPRIPMERRIENNFSPEEIARYGPNEVEGTRRFEEEMYQDALRRGAENEARGWREALDRSEEAQRIIRETHIKKDFNEASAHREHMKKRAEWEEATGSVNTPTNMERTPNPWDHDPRDFEDEFTPTDEEDRIAREAADIGPEIDEEDFIFDQDELDALEAELHAEPGDPRFDDEGIPQGEIRRAPEDIAAMADDELAAEVERLRNELRGPLDNASREVREVTARRLAAVLTEMDHRAAGGTPGSPYPQGPGGAPVSGITNGPHASPGPAIQPGGPGKSPPNLPPLAYGGSGGQGGSFGPFPPENLDDVIAKAGQTGHVTPGYFPSQITPRLRQGGKNDPAFQFSGPMQYTGKLYRLGIEDASLDTLRRGANANIDRRQAWNTMARALEDNALPYRGPITKQWADMQNDGLNPRDFVWVSQRKLLADAADKDIDFAAAVAQNSGTPGSQPGHFRTDNSLVAIPKAAWDGMIDPPGRLRGVNNVNRFLKTKASRVILGTANIPWLQFQILSNVALAGIAKTGPMDMVKAQLWWRGLTDEQRAAVEPYLGQGHFAWDVDTPQLLPDTNSRFISAYRAFKETRKGQTLSKLWPLNWMFKADHAQNAFFRRSVLHSQVKRQAYQQLNRNAGKIDGAQERLTNVFGLGPKEQMDAIIRNPKLMEEHASYVNEFLGDYLSFTPLEREWLASNVMFYAFLRYSLKMTFYTMPVRHPTMAAVLGKLGSLDPQETRKLLGDGVLPYQLGKFFFEDGKMVMDLSRANPALSAFTQSSTPLQVMASMLPPHLSMLLFTQGATIIPYTGGKVRVRGETQPQTPDTWGALDPTRARVLARQTLSLIYPYRVVERVLSQGEPLGADHLVFSPRPTKYKRADIVASVARDRRNTLSQSAERRVMNELFPWLPRPSREKEIAKNRVKRGKRAANAGGGAPGSGGSSSGGGGVPGS